MALERLVIENFRSIERLDLLLGSMSALIGPNNAGKSNILKALDLVLGETWPGKPLPERDYYALDTTRTISITAFFSTPLRCDADVRGFRLTCSTRNGVDYVPVGRDGNPRTWGPGGREKRVSNLMRSEVALLYLDLERLAQKQLRPTQWTLYGKLLREIERRIPEDQKEAFVRAVEQGLEDHLRPHLTNARQIVDDLVRRQTGLEAGLDFRAVDPLEVLKTVRPFLIEGDMNSDPEEVGAGVQSALGVAIARAYAEIVRQPLVLALEEPELYLHPHGCRHFYRLLQELTRTGLQVLYTTHARAFISAGDFESLHIVRKTDGPTAVTSGRTYVPLAGVDPLRIQSKFNERLNELFFSLAAVLTEGDPDEIACRCAMDRLGVDLDRRSISILALGGKDEIAVVSHLLVALGIPVFALLDEDPGNADSAATRGRVAGIVGPQRVLLHRPTLEGMFGLPRKPNKVHAMANFPQWFGRAGNLTPQVYVDLAAALNAVT